MSGKRLWESNESKHSIDCNKQQAICFLESDINWSAVGHNKGVCNKKNGKL